MGRALVYIMLYCNLQKVGKNILDDKDFGGAVLMDLSKAFDTFYHDLLIAKFSDYGFTNESVRLIES